jgi:hypothetical protein
MSKAWGALKESASWIASQSGPIRSRGRLVRLSLGLLLVGAVVSTGACNFSSLSTSETDVVLTIEDEDRNYSDYKTYALTDKVIDLCEVAGEDGELPLGGRFSADVGTCFEVTHRYDELVLDTIDENMKALGYTKVDSPNDNPDVTVLVAALAQDNWYYAPGYWWCDPYYYYYCWYPTASYVYNLPTGTLLINMVDNSETTDKRLSSAWFAALSGLYAQADDKTGQERIEDGVNRAFTQSPYLEVK